MHHLRGQLQAPRAWFPSWAPAARGSQQSGSIPAFCMALGGLSLLLHCPGSSCHSSVPRAQKTPASQGSSTLPVGGTSWWSPGPAPLTWRAAAQGRLLQKCPPAVV